jgi:hypothetical protein
MLIWSLGASRGPRRPIFLKISTMGNNRWPYAIVAYNRAYLATSERLCSRQWADDGYLEFGRFPGPRRPIFLKISTIGNTAGPMHSSLVTELIWQRLSVSAAGSGQTMVIWSLGASRGLRRPIFLKISTIGNNRRPYAIVALNRAYMDIEGPPYGRRSADNAD